MFIDFDISLPVLTNRKDKTYDFILVIVDWLIKIGYYKQIIVTINNPQQTKIMIEMILTNYCSLY